MCDRLVTPSALYKNRRAVELAVTKPLLPNLLELVRAWLTETECKPVRVEQVEAQDNIVLRFFFEIPECARAFRYAFERS